MARRGGEGTGAAPQEAWGTLSSYVQHSRSLGLSVTLSLPLVVLYQVGIVQRGSPVGWCSPCGTRNAGARSRWPTWP